MSDLGRTSVETRGEKGSAVLLVSHNFPPLHGAESLLVRNNAVDLHQRGWQVGVVTSPRHSSRAKVDAGLLADLPPEIEVLRTESNGGLSQPDMGKIQRVLLGHVESRWLPCPNLMWEREAVRLGLGWLAKNPEAVIYSRAPRNVSNLAARVLKQHTRRPWVAHFSDPWWDFSYDGLIHRTWIRLLERRVVREADALVFPNRPLADKVMAKYPAAWADKVHVIPHGFANFPSMPNIERDHKRPLRLLHMGAFYPVYRTPDTLFQGLALLNERMPLKGRLSLECVGEETTCFQSLVDRLGLQEIVSLKPAVPYAQCQEMTAQADLLVVVDVSYGLRGVFLPTKLIEYFAFLKPVLGIAPPRSAVAQTLQNCGLECPNQDDPQEIAMALERQLQAWDAGMLEVSPRGKAKMAQYHFPVVNQPLHELLSSLARGRF
ncbi:glycosyltransferase [Prosthecobacter dejongeii]|uniref:Glycosyltransferase subfamily 4-like N-terminal domain-containing protein n=1 Tax=Prosthecobacter dejongeii TaxID=48465 RepID=A0A7W8DNS8_9BACT|nr:glycosyltransferase [Prosthecobacter dejongeii]MBB5036874.1 hypothetical protein [Prosthecobacter dejongeii]